MKKLKKELAEFTPERFNDHYRNLIDIAIPSSREYEMLHVLNFISDCQTAIDNVKEALQKLPDEPLAKRPDETHCPMCVEKERTIQLSANRIQHLENTLKIQDSNLQTLRDFRDEALKELNLIKGNQLKVCK